MSTLQKTNIDKQIEIRTRQRNHGLQSLQQDVNNPGILETLPIMKSTRIYTIEWLLWITILLLLNVMCLLMTEVL